MEGSANNYQLGHGFLFFFLKADLLEREKMALRCYKL